MPLKTKIYIGAGHYVPQGFNCILDFVSCVFLVVIASHLRTLVFV